MLLPLALVFSLDQHAPQLTFESVEAEKAKAFYETPTFREIARLQEEGKANKWTVRRTMEVDGLKRHVLIENNEIGKVAEIVCDGRQLRAFSHPAKAYYDCSAPSERPKPSGYSDPHGHMDPLEPGEVRPFFNSDSPVGFVTKEKFVFVSDGSEKLGGKPFRKIVMAFDSSFPPPHKVSLTQWFYPGTWFLRRMELAGIGQDGKPSAMVWEFEVDTKPTFKDSTFTFSSASVEGFRKMDPPPPK